MVFKEKIGKISNLIEQEVKKSKTKHKISKTITSELGISARDLSCIFSFIIGRTFFDYIRERKMMSAYEFIITSKNFNVNKAIELSGLGDQPTFNKSFKKMFNMTPTEAFKNKDVSLLQSPLSWDNLNALEHSHDIPLPNSRRSESFIFGIQKDKYDELKEMVQLQETYSFDDLQSNLAYYVYTTYNIPLKNAFEFVYDFDYDEYKKSVEYLMEDTDDNLDGYRDYCQYYSNREGYYTEYAKKYADDPEVRYVYFNGCFDSVYSVISTIEDLHDLGEKDVTKIDIDAINTYYHSDMHISYCKRAVEYFKANSQKQYDFDSDVFSKYIESLLDNSPIEEAFLNSLMFGDDDDDIYDYGALVMYEEEHPDRFGYDEEDEEEYYDTEENPNNYKDDEDYIPDEDEIADRLGFDKYIGDEGYDNFEDKYYDD